MIRLRQDLLDLVDTRCGCRGCVRRTLLRRRKLVTFGPARAANHGHDVERGGRDPGGQTSPSSHVQTRPGCPDLVQRLRLVQERPPHFLYLLASRRCLREKRPHHRPSLCLPQTFSLPGQTADPLTSPPFFFPQTPSGTSSPPKCKPSFSNGRTRPRSRTPRQPTTSACNSSWRNYAPPSYSTASPAGATTPSFSSTGGAPGDDPHGLFRRIPLGPPPTRANNHHHDVERGGRIAGTPRHTPEQTVHRSRRDGRPALFSLLQPVRSTPPRPDPRMVRGTVRTSPHPSATWTALRLQREGKLPPTLNITKLYLKS